MRASASCSPAVTAATLARSGVACTDYGAVTKRSTLLVASALLAGAVAGGAAGIFGGVLAFGGVLMAAFVLLALADYRTGVFVALILLPLSSTLLMPREMFGIIGLNPFNATLALSLVPLTMMLLFQRQAIDVPPFPRPFWLYLGLLCLATMYGALHVGLMPEYFNTEHIVNFDSPMGYVRDIFLRPLLLLITAGLLSLAVRNARRPQVFLIPLFVSAAIMPLVVIGYVAQAGVSLVTLAAGNERNFLSPLGMHANELGFLFNMSFALTLFTFVSVRNLFARIVLGLLLGILTVAIVLTFSRGAFLGYLTVVLYFLVRHRQFSVMLLGLMLVISAAALMPQAIVERISAGTHSGSMDAISAGRWDGIWRPLLPQIWTSPLIGRGLSSVMWSDAAREGAMLRVGHPHSAYLGVLLDMGVVGVAVVVTFFRHMWIQFTTAARETDDPLWRGFFLGGTACILLLLVQGITDDRFTPTPPQIYLWLSYGIAIGLRRRWSAPERNRRQREEEARMVGRIPEQRAGAR